MRAEDTSHMSRKDSKNTQKVARGRIFVGPSKRAPRGVELPAVDVVRLLRGLCAGIASSAPVELTFAGVEECHVSNDCAASLLLIVGEAVTNAVKYAHPTQIPGRISVDCRRSARGALVVEIADDGVGLPEHFDPDCAGHFGFKLMRAQSAALGASLSCVSTGLGLRIRLQVPADACGLAIHHPDIRSTAHSPLPNGGRDSAACSCAAHAGMGKDGRFHDLLQALPAAIYTTDAGGRITFYNEAAAALWGCRPELGKSEFCGSWKLYWPDGRPMPHDECPMALALRHGRPIRGMEAIAERPDGVRIPFIPYPSPLYDAQGSIKGAVNLLVDITERRAAEDVAERLAAIVGSSEDAIISKDLNGILTSWNPGAERLFGYRADEVIGKPVTTLIPPALHDEEPEILARIRRGEHVEHYETIRQRKDGSQVEVSLSVSPVKDATGRTIGAAKIARDITERKRAEERQALLTDELQHRTKNLFAVVLSVVSRSFVGKRTVEDAEMAVLSRLHSLAQTHIILAEKDWEGADLADVVRTELAPHADRLTIEGPVLFLAPRAAQSFALALHELATNAAKYGALSTLAGRVRISWSVLKPNGHRLFSFRWEERGGPRVNPPKQRGFGTTVLERVMADYFDAPPRLDFAECGVTYELNGSLDGIVAGSSR